MQNATDNATADNVNRAINRARVRNISNLAYALAYARADYKLAKRDKREASAAYGRERTQTARAILSKRTAETNSAHANAKRAARALHVALFEAGKTAVAPR